jgi:peptidoglycan/LPS O-acetylase OafA/YrhL
MLALDGLRGVAILMVILTHAWTGWIAAMAIYGDSRYLPRTFTLPNWVDRISGSAVHGVTLFFVISAFTLTVRFAGNQDGDLRHYALRRVARIGPAFWLAGLCYAVGTGLGPRFGAPDGMNAFDLAVAALFGSAWWSGPANAVVPGGWSISCEVAFYIALPVILWTTRYGFRRTLALTAILGLAAQMLGRHGMVGYGHPVMQAPVFLCGVAAAIAAMHIRVPRHDLLAIVPFLVAIFGVPFSPILGWFVEQHFQFAALAATGVVLVARHPVPILTSRLLRRIGEVSFSMYLLHFAMLAPSLYICERLVPGDGWLTLLCHFSLSTGTAFAFACVSYRLIEKPSIDCAASYIRAKSAQAPSPAA